MESIKNSFLFVLVVLCVFLGNAQQMESDASPAISKLLNTESITLKNIVLDNNKSNASSVLNRNIVQISQLGQSNDTDIVIRSSKSNLKVSQNGSNNNLEFNKSAKELSQTIVQTGNENYISDTSLYYGKPIDMTISQQGNNLKLINSGTNSISKDLKISQSGNSGSVYIFNH